jgi:hypothetical protein
MKNQLKMKSQTFATSLLLLAIVAMPIGGCVIGDEPVDVSDNPENTTAPIARGGDGGPFATNIHCSINYTTEGVSVLGHNPPKTYANGRVSLTVTPGFDNFSKVAVTNMLTGDTLIGSFDGDLTAELVSDEDPTHPVIESTKVVRRVTSIVTVRTASGDIGEISYQSSRRGIKGGSLKLTSDENPSTPIFVSCEAH